MRIDKPKRSRKATKRLDLTDLRAILRDGRQWAGLGVVVAPSDGTDHWRVHSEDGSAVDILVEVTLQPGQEQVTARLAAGMWLVPAIGEEVAVIIPAGKIDFSPIIVGILSSNSVPQPMDGQGPTPTQIVIARGKVLIHDGNGGAKALAYLSDVQAVDQKYAMHLHQDSTNAPTGPPVDSVPPNPSAPPPYLPDTGVPLTPAELVGTSVLLGK